jgi:hypothetical protein
MVRRGNVAIKLPLKYDTTGRNEDRVKLLNASSSNSSEVIERKEKVYRRLGPIDSTVPFLDQPDIGIHIAFMQIGPIADYLKKHSPDQRHS